jgi:putative flippase GtrA
MRRATAQPERLQGFRRILREIFSFTVIGAAGFGVDTSVLYGAIHLGFGLYVGRGISYLVSVTFTWALNSRYTFKQRVTSGRFGQWQRFALSQLSGAVINLGVYSALVAMSSYCAAHPVIGVAAGSLSGLLVNFAAARRFVFAR